MNLENFNKIKTKVNNVSEIKNKNKNNDTNIDSSSPSINDKNDTNIISEFINTIWTFINDCINATQVFIDTIWNFLNYFLDAIKEFLKNFFELMYCMDSFKFISNICYEVVKFFSNLFYNNWSINVYREKFQNYINKFDWKKLCDELDKLDEKIKKIQKLNYEEVEFFKIFEKMSKIIDQFVIDFGCMPINHDFVDNQNIVTIIIEFDFDTIFGTAILLISWLLSNNYVSDFANFLPSINFDLLSYYIYFQNIKIFLIHNLYFIIEYLMNNSYFLYSYFDGIGKFFTLDIPECMNVTYVQELIYLDDMKRFKYYLKQARKLGPHMLQLQYSIDNKAYLLFLKILRIYIERKEQHIQSITVNEWLYEPKYDYFLE